MSSSVKVMRNVKRRRLYSSAEFREMNVALLGVVWCRLWLMTKRAMVGMRIMLACCKWVCLCAVSGRPWTRLSSHDSNSTLFAISLFSRNVKFTVLSIKIWVKIRKLYSFFFSLRYNDSCASVHFNWKLGADSIQSWNGNCEGFSFASHNNRHHHQHHAIYIHCCADEKANIYLFFDTLYNCVGCTVWLTSSSHAIGKMQWNG